MISLQHLHNAIGAGRCMRCSREKALAHAWTDVLEAELSMFEKVCQ
jgi:hypothetical protein